MDPSEYIKAEWRQTQIQALQLQRLIAWESSHKRAPSMVRALRLCIISLRIYEGIHEQSKTISFFVVETWLLAWVF